MNGVLVDYTLIDPNGANSANNREWWFNDIRTATTETGFATKTAAFRAARRARRQHYASAA